MINPLRSFRVSIALSFGTAILILTIIFSSAIGVTVRTHITDDVRKQMQVLAEKLASDLDRGMYERYTDGKIVTSMLTIGETLSLEQQQRLLSELQTIFPEYSWIGIADTDGIIIADTGQFLVGEDVSSRQWFINGIKAPYVGDIHETLLLSPLLQNSDDAHIRLVDIAMPLRTVSGTIIGVLGMHLNWDWAHQIYQTLLTTDVLNADIELFILNELNEIILGPQGYEGSIPEGLFADIDSPQKHSLITIWQGEMYLVGTAHTEGYGDYRGLGWRIITREPLARAFEPANQLSGTILIVGLILGVIFVGMGWLLAGRVTRPLEAIVEAVKPIEQGNISANIPQLDDNREIATLSTAVQSMLTHLRAEIDERKHVEQSLRQSEEKLRNMLEKTAQGVLLVNSKGTIMLVNRYLEQIFGYSREELLGQNMAIFVPPPYNERHEQFVSDYVKQPVERRMGIRRELPAIKRDGTVFPAEISLTPLELDGEVHVMAFLVDISERKRLEEQELYTQQLELELAKERELIQIKERFVSLVSHEFRTPLAVIQSSVNMIIDYIDRMPTERVLERLHIASDHIQRMSSMMEDALRFSKTSSGKEELKRETIDIPDFVQDIVSTMRMIDKDQHELITHVDAGFLYADRKVLEHVLSNLISNALKYSAQGTQVLIQAWYTQEGWQFSVEDEGIGFPEEDIPKLFEPFYRASNARETTGTGLGLSIVKDYVELHNGSITVKRKSDRGSCFIVHIPQGTTD